MTLIELNQLLNKAMEYVPSDTEVLLCYEDLDEPFDIHATAGIGDVRLIEDWPLPGTSLATHEDKPSKVVLFYGSEYKLAAMV